MLQVLEQPHDRLRTYRRFFYHLCLLGLLGLGLGLGVRMGQLHQASGQPADAILVLGGSIQREIAVVQQRQAGETLPILISQGSADPCIWQLFQRSQVPMHQVWLEKCARSTFGNLVYSLPTLRDWGSRHVRLVTSQSHLPRALWMGKVLFGSHGIWVEVVVVPETGRPGNRETAAKTALDLMRTVGWAIISQIYQPRCSQVVPLRAVNMATWRVQGFKCEHQAGLDELDQPDP